ncbi:MAG: hypothetical protein GY774_39620 [Planctomycetes bacterium]|nr:hypothetical protein [Planctomycetota bacterium]
MRLITNRIALSYFLLSTSLVIFGFGVFVGKAKIFPYNFIHKSYQLVRQLIRKEAFPHYYRKGNYTERLTVYEKDEAFDSLNLVVCIASNRQLSISVMNMEGHEIHKWNIDWFALWPNPNHLPDEAKPKSKPGTLLHGAVLLQNGDLVFNFSFLGLIRINKNGDVIWRLPYRTHHSIHEDEHGNLWVCGQKHHDKPLPKFPNYIPPFIEPTILQVSPEGNIIEEISVLDLLKENGLYGLMYMGSLVNSSTAVSGDILHLNDIETFPNHLKEGFFKKDDIMISLRNINTIIVFNHFSREIRFIRTGGFVRQHDPDFIDGNTISVYDNNNIAPESYGYQSRIVLLSAIDNRSLVYYQGSENCRFYSDILGKHQWLPNGNLIISEPTNGRAFEINKNGNIVWEYFNVVGDGMIGWMSEVQRLPSHYSRLFNENQNE